MRERLLCRDKLGLWKLLFPSLFGSNRQAKAAASNTMGVTILVTALGIRILVTDCSQGYNSQPGV